VLALTLHVTYWDNLGWPDRFGLPQATQRQRGYAEALRLRSVFTPQTVIDGRRSFVESDWNAVTRELLQPRDGPPISVTLSDGELTIGWRMECLSRNLVWRGVVGCLPTFRSHLHWSR
jgi:hypothetical protein